MSDEEDIAPPPPAPDEEYEEDEEAPPPPAPEDDDDEDAPPPPAPEEDDEAPAPPPPQDEETESEAQTDETSDVCVVIDFGSGLVKAGLSTDEAPTLIFPSKVGRPREAFKDELSEPYYIGDQLNDYELTQKLSLYTPIMNGVIMEWDDAELIFRYIYEKLGVQSQKHPLVMTEPPFIPLESREQLTAMMFDTFQVPCLTIQLAGLLALTGQGKTTGLVLDIGQDLCHTIPVWEGNCFVQAIGKLQLGGHDLNVLFAKLLSQSGNALTSSADRLQAAKMKEETCYTSEDPFQEEAEFIDYKFPGGRVISVGDERWKAVEVLFDPTKIGREAQGVHNMIWNTIMKCTMDCRRALVSHIVISGGSTMFPGFDKRLAEEVKNVVPTATAASVKVYTPDGTDGTKAVWIGGQVVATLRNVTADQWMTREDYDEYGAEYIHDVVPIKYTNH